MIVSVALGDTNREAAIPRLPLTAFIAAPGAGDRFAVMVVERDGSMTRAKLRLVEVGNVIGNRVAVVHGLTAGERVITMGASMVKDGERVEAMPTEVP